MHVEYNEKSDRLRFTTPSRLSPEVRELSGVRRLRTEGNEIQWSMPVTLTSFYQLAKDFPDATYDETCLAERAHTKAHRAYRMSLKAGKLLQEHALLDPRGGNEQTIGYNLMLSGSLLLADDMGFGKTVMCCAALQDLNGLDQEVLILGNKSSIGVWVEHLAEWAPKYSVFVVHGTPTQQAKAIAAYEEHGGHKVMVSSHRLATKYSSLASYGNIAASGEPGPFNRDWDVCIIDEITEAARKVRADTLRAFWKIGSTSNYRWAVTGTPIEREGDEFFALMHFVEPDLFVSVAKARQRYMITEVGYWGGRESHGLHPDMERQFWYLLEPYYLRRESTRLPSLDPEHLTLPLVGKQKRVYTDLVKHMMATTNDGDLIVAADALELNPLLSWAANGVPAVDESGKVIALEGPSNKLDWVVDTAQKRAGRPLVVYADSPLVCDLGIEMLQKKGIPARKITGSTTEKSRTSIRQAFQNGAVPVLFITKAGSSSITLTAADLMVFIQPSYIATVNDQAMKRIHREGQEHDCRVIFLYSEGTVDHQRRVILEQKLTTQDQLLGLKGLKRFLEGQHATEGS